MRRWLWVVIIAVIAGGVVAYARTRNGAQDTSPRWQTTQVTRGDLIVSVAASGTIRPVSEVEVKSRATGIVQVVRVSEGDRVVKGQMLVQIDDPDAAAAVRSARASQESAVARLRQAEAQRLAQRAQDAAQVRQAEASLAGAQARLQQLLAGPRPEEVAQAEQAVRLAQAELDLAQREFERSEQLFKEGLVARQQLDQAEARLRSARAQHQSATERLNQVRSGPTAEQIAEARAAARQAEAALEQARARSLEDPVREQEIAAARAQVTLARSSLFNVEQRLAETVIRAPVSGVVARRSVEVGQSVIGGSVGATVLTLAVDQPLLAKVMVDEGDVARVRPGLRVEIRAEGLPDDRFTGRTLAVSPNAQTVSNVVQYEVTVQVEDPQRLLRLGMSVDAEFIVTSRAGVLLIPKEALRGETTKAVFVVEGEKLTPRLVQVGGTDGRMVEIRSGLQGSEIVYLGEARRQAEERQQRNPFAPDFRRRPTPGGR